MERPTGPWIAAFAVAGAGDGTGFCPAAGVAAIFAVPRTGLTGVERELDELTRLGELAGVCADACELEEGDAEAAGDAASAVAFGATVGTTDGVIGTAMGFVSIAPDTLVGVLAGLADAPVAEAAAETPAEIVADAAGDAAAGSPTVGAL